MKPKGLSQEGLKLIACVTMLIDHIGATLVLQLLRRGGADTQFLLYLYRSMRIIGRIAFPIYCFLLVEGFRHTRDAKKYIARLFIGMLLSEIPFDLAFNPGVFYWRSNSVMVTLLLGGLMLASMEKTEGFWKYAVIVPFYYAAELLHTDYAGLGIAIIAAFALTRDLRHEKLLCTLALALLVMTGMRDMQIGPIWVRTESFAMFSLIPIFCYGGHKLTRSKTVQWAFYLFYPAHLTLLALLQWLIFRFARFQ